MPPNPSQVALRVTTVAHGTRGRSATRTRHREETRMSKPQESVETQTDLSADMLIEEVSIDGMCGVY
ncbi:hypothetical protein GCM10027215_18220 [Nocardioides zeae]